MLGMPKSTQAKPVTPGSREVLDRLFNALWREGLHAGRRLSADGRRAILKLNDQSELLAHVEHRRALDRLRTAPPYVLRKAGEGRLEKLRTPAQAVERLATLWGEPGLNWPLLQAELEQSSTNLDRFFAAVPARAAELIARGHEHTLAAGEVALEGWNLRGHELHPGCKTRFGFSSEELERYSPELGCRLDLHFVALRRDHAVDTAIAPADLPAAWREVLETELESPDEYHLLAVHPWQYQHKLPELFADEFQSGALRALKASFPATPLASLRTVVPLDQPGAHHLKLPLAVQSTSALRTVSPQSAQNGPRLSALLRQIPGVTLQAEERGIHFWREGEDLDRARHLSLLFRQAPEPVPGTWLVPVAVLSERNPLDGRALVAEAVELSGGDPVAFAIAYTELTARTFLPALFEYGVAIEAHGQNCLVRLRQGQPVELVLRDLGGIRILFDWLHRRGLDVRLHPASVVIARTPEELVAKSHHTYLQGHLAPVFSALAETFKVPERLLWRAASRVFREHWCYGPEAERLWFAPRIEVKALTRMRLGGRSHQYDFCQVENPLA